jgi:predicted nucleic acid-binding protein
MISAVDSNVLLDVFSGDPAHGPSSQEALRRCLAEGGLVACDVVIAEVAAWFPTPAEMVGSLQTLGLRFDPIGLEAAVAAGSAWVAYRRSGGRRDRVLHDFLVAAHAITQADRLVSRDRGYYRRYFRDLALLDPVA